MNNTLPTEILSMILILLNPTDRCKAELVCHGWYKHSRSSPHIWRCAKDIASNDIPDSVALKDKLDNILLRSGGKLHNLAIRISSSTKSEAKSSRHMLECLPAIEVKHLWIDCGTRWTCQASNGRIRLFKNSFNSNLRKHISRSIQNCGHIQSLHLATPQGTECVNLDGGGESLFSQCGINSLSLLSDSFECFFADMDKVKIMRQLKSLQIRSVAPGWNLSGMSSQWLSRLLQQCSRTLEWAELEVGTLFLLEIDELCYWPDVHCPELPLLRYLKLIGCESKSDAKDQIDHFSFPSCPALTELYVLGRIPEKCVLELIDGSFSSLKIFGLALSNTKYFNDLLLIKQLCKHLQRCHGLKKISVEGPTELLLDHLSKTGLSALVHDTLCQDQSLSTQDHLRIKTKVSDLFDGI